MSDDKIQSNIFRDLLSLAEPQLCVVSLEEFLNLKLPPQENILSPWLSTQGLALIYAPRGIGKTHVALGIAHAVASGGKFLRWEAPKPRGVLYIDGEMPANMMQERLSKIVAASETDANVPFKILTPDLQPKMGMPDLATSRGQQAIEPFVEDVELIIVDNIATLCRRGNENDTEAWKPVQEWALKMRASGKAVLFIHHAGKKGAQRGASAHEDTLSVVIRLSRPENYSPSQGAVFEIHFEKSRGLFGGDIKPFKASLTQSSFKDDDQNLIEKQCWITDDLPPDMPTMVIEKMNEGLKQSEIAKALNIHKSNVSRYIKKAKQEGLVKLPSFTS